MFKSYRIHQEQIRNVASNLKKINQNKKPDPLTSQRVGNRTPIQNCSRNENAVLLHVQKPLRETGAVKRRIKNIQAGTPPEMEAYVLNTVAIRCLRCGERFPVTDFLYTKKTSLCISCWEEKEVCHGNERKNRNEQKLCRSVSR